MVIPLALLDRAASIPSFGRTGNRRIWCSSRHSDAFAAHRGELRRRIATQNWFLIMKSARIMVRGRAVCRAEQLHAASE